MRRALAVPLAAGKLSATVAGNFGTSYAVFPSSLSTGFPWLTDFAVTDVTPTAFTVQFALPIPPGGATLWVEIVDLP